MSFCIHLAKKLGGPLHLTRHKFKSHTHMIHYIYIGVSSKSHGGGGPNESTGSLIGTGPKIGLVPNKSRGSQEVQGVPNKSKRSQIILGVPKKSRGSQ